MKIYFVATESTDRNFFESELGMHELEFVDELNEVGADAEAVSIFIYSQIDASFLDSHPALKLVTTRSTAFDHIDLEECARRQVSVSCVPTYGDHTVAEHAFALLLAVARELREAVNFKAHFSYEAIRSIELRGKTLGLIGAGRIGQAMVPIAKAFGLEVAACDVREQPEAAARLGFRYVTLDELLRTSHFISLHIPLSSATRHILDRTAFEKCRRGVIVINTARGGLIDTQALMDAMDFGVVGGAGLDVLEDESAMRKEALSVISEQIVNRMTNPDASQTQDATRIKELQDIVRNKELLSRRNVIFTPHTAFNSMEAVERINTATVENIKAFDAGAPINIVTRQSSEASKSQ